MDYAGIQLEARNYILVLHSIAPSGLKYVRRRGDS